jgi:hypothetical protein
MKIRNLYLALKDQMPLSRLIRNLRKGHIFGLFSINSHVRGDTGVAKIAYSSKESATKAAEKDKKAKAAERKQKAQELLALISEKEGDALKGKSLEELRAQFAQLQSGEDEE